MSDVDHLSVTENDKNLLILDIIAEKHFVLHQLLSNRAYPYWKSFEKWLDLESHQSDFGVLVAWNGRIGFFPHTQKLVSDVLDVHLPMLC